MSGRDLYQEARLIGNLPPNLKPGTYTVEKTKVTESITEMIDPRAAQTNPTKHFEYSESYSSYNAPIKGQLGTYSQISTQSYQPSTNLTTSSLLVAPDNYPEFSTAAWRMPQGQFYKNLIEQLRFSSKKYTDYDFPAYIESLTGGDPVKSIKWESMAWRRAPEIWPESKLQLFSGSLHPNDIRQGQLGNVYLIATLSALLENPQRIKKLFSTDRINEFGCYAVRICDMGEWREVIVDDLIPCFDKQSGPSFTIGKENELWVPLLEKAWAKLYNSYAKIEVGIPLEMLHDLTGAPTQYFFLQNVDSGVVWKELSRGTKMGFPIVADSKDSVDFGLLGAHYYTVIDAFELETEAGTKRVLKLRDPWQETKWKGEWTDNWPAWSAENKKIVGFDYREKNVFFISFEEFLRWFDNVQICQVHDDFAYSHIKTKADSRKGTYFRLRVKRSGHYYISINQKSKRFFKPSENYKYSYANLVIGQEIREGDYEFIDGVQKAEREITREVYLNAGVYYVYTKFYWNDKISREFSLSCYGQDEVEIDQISKYRISDFLEKVYISKARTNKSLKGYEEEGEPNVFRVSELTPEGIGYFYFLNRGNSPLTTEYNFKIMQGVKLRKPHRGTSFKINVNPGEEKIVLTKINPNVDAKQVFTELPSFFKTEVDLVRTAKDKGNKKQRSDTKSGQPVDIWCYVYQHTEGVIMVYENRTLDLVLDEEVKFELKGLRLEDDPYGDKVKFQLGPGQTKVIKLKKVLPETAISYSVSYLVKSAVELNPLPKSDIELKILAKQKGQLKPRKDTKTGQPVDINCYVYQHPDGVIMVYENNTYNKVLDEEVKFELKGLRIEEDPYASKVSVVLGPNQFKVIRLKKYLDEFAISYNVSYLVKDLLEVPQSLYTQQSTSYGQQPSYTQQPCYTQQPSYTQPFLKQSDFETSKTRPYLPEKPLSSQPLSYEKPTYSQQPYYGQSYLQPKQESLEDELKRKAKELGSRKQRKDTKTGNNVEIFLYVLQYEDGVLLLYENNTPDLLLDEEITFELKGLTLAEDPGKKVLRFELGPGKDRAVYLKKIAPEFSILYNVSYIVKYIGKGGSGAEKLSEWELRKLAKEQGQKKQRKDTKNGDPVEIYVYVLQHEHGVYMLYENNTTNLELDEEIAFELKGLELADDPKGDMVRFILKPGDRKGIFINRVAEEYAISYNVSYLLKKLY